MRTAGLILSHLLIATTTIVGSFESRGAVSPVVNISFSEGNGATAADASGNGNAGQLMNGAFWTGGRVGNGVGFDGIDDIVEVANSTTVDSPRTAITVSGWM